MQNKFKLVETSTKGIFTFRSHNKQFGAYESKQEAVYSLPEHFVKHTIPVDSIEPLIEEIMSESQLPLFTDAERDAFANHPHGDEAIQTLAEGFAEYINNFCCIVRVYEIYLTLPRIPCIYYFNDTELNQAVIFWKHPDISLVIENSKYVLYSNFFLSETFHCKQQGRVQVSLGIESDNINPLEQQRLLKGVEQLDLPEATIELLN